MHGGDDLANLLLNGPNTRGNLFGLVRRPLCQLAHLGRDDREAFPMLSGPGGFNRRVQGQEIGLGGDIVDGLHNLPDFRAALPQGFYLLGTLLVPPSSPCRCS